MVSLSEQSSKIWPKRVNADTRNVGTVARRFIAPCYTQHIHIQAVDRPPAVVWFPIFCLLVSLTCGERGQQHGGNAGTHSLPGSVVVEDFNVQNPNGQGFNSPHAVCNYQMVSIKANVSKS